MSTCSSTWGYDQAPADYWFGVFGGGWGNPFGTPNAWGANPYYQGIAPSARLEGVLPGLPVKAPCRAATTGANLYLSGYATIDGVSFGSADEASNANMRVLVKDQTDLTQNGILRVNSGLWTRELDFAGNNSVVQGSQVFVTQGAANGGEVFVVTSPDPQNIGTDPVTFAGISQETFGNTLSLSMAGSTLGTVMSFTLTDSRIVAPSASVQGSRLKLVPQSPGAASLLPQTWIPVSTGGSFTVNFVNDGSSAAYPFTYEITI